MNLNINWIFHSKEWKYKYFSKVNQFSPTKQILFYIHLHIILILDSAYERKHMVFAFLNLDHYVQYNNCQLYPFSWQCHYFLLHYGYIKFNPVYKPHVLHSFICWKAYRMLALSSILSSVAKTEYTSIWVVCWYTVQD